MFVIQVKYMDEWFYVHSILPDGIGITRDVSMCMSFHGYPEAALFAGVIGTKFPHFAEGTGLCVIASLQCVSRNDFDAQMLIF